MPGRYRALLANKATRTAGYSANSALAVLAFHSPFARPFGLTASLAFAAARLAKTVNANGLALADISLATKFFILAAGTIFGTIIAAGIIGVGTAFLAIITGGLGGAAF